MLSKNDKEIINMISKKYSVKKVILFGSSLSNDDEAADIDLAVEGLDSGRFFEYYGELLFGLSKPVDVVDLSRKTRFTDYISRKGVVIYEWTT